MKAKRILLFLTIMLCVSACVFYVDRQVLLVRDVVVEGNHLFSDEDILEYALVEQGQSLLQLRKGLVRSNVEKISHFVICDVKWDFSGRVTLKITERTVVAYAEWADKYILLDPYLLVLEARDIHDAGDMPDLPELVGIDVTDPVAGRPLEAPLFLDLPKKDRAAAREPYEMQMAAASRALNELHAQGEFLNVRQINVSEPWELRMVTRSGFEVLFGPARDLNLKIARMAELLPRVREMGYLQGILDVAEVDAPAFIPALPGFSTG
ncbi:MAG: FtsQ-type POTRA domain-containing protein [Clostridia bacterium]|nr:FtsQ-type POTRA domain-containing protein [Clostridia bacterium]